MKGVEQMYPRSDDFDILLKRGQESWNRWINQVAVIGFKEVKSSCKECTKNEAYELLQGRHGKWSCNRILPV